MPRQGVHRNTPVKGCDYRAREYRGIFNTGEEPLPFSWDRDTLELGESPAFGGDVFGGSGKSPVAGEEEITVPPPTHGVRLPHRGS